MLIDDSPDRWINNLGPSRSFAILSHSDGTSNVSDSEVESATPRSVERPKSSQPPRREVSWLNLGANSQSLESIAHHFQKDYIDCFLSSSTLRRVRASDDLSTHTCPGYIREEITLTSEVSKSAIVSHASADPGERCSFCGDLVVLRDINFERDFGQWFDPDEEEGLQSPRDLEEDDFDFEDGDFEWFNLDKAKGMQRPWDQEEQDRDFERDFGQWFNSDKANGMQRPKDRNVERDFGQSFNPDKVEKLQRAEDRNFERDFGQWFNPDKAEKMQRAEDRNFERDFGQWFNPDKVEGMQRAEDRNFERDFGQWFNPNENGRRGFGIKENSNVLNFDLSR